MHVIERENTTMKIQAGLKGLTQQPAAMAMWFLIAPKLSRLAGKAEAWLVLKRKPRRISKIYQKL